MRVKYQMSFARNEGVTNVYCAGIKDSEELKIPSLANFRSWRFLRSLGPSPRDACERRLFWWGDCDECERGGAKGFGNGSLYIHNFLENDLEGYCQLAPPTLPSRNTAPLRSKWKRERKDVILHVLGNQKVSCGLCWLERVGTSSTGSQIVNLFPLPSRLLGEERFWREIFRL